MNMTDKPLAARGLTSYRCKNRYGWTMIGAKDDDDAMREARRSDPNADVKNLEVWTATGYEPTTRAIMAGAQ